MKTQDEVVHDKTNSWFNGKEWIPVKNMTNKHLKKAKLFAQRNEEYHFHKSNEFAEKVEMLEEEAARRNIELADYKSRFQNNTSNYIKRKAKRLAEAAATSPVGE